MSSCIIQCTHYTHISLNAASSRRVRAWGDVKIRMACAVKKFKWLWSWMISACWSRYVDIIININLLLSNSKELEVTNFDKHLKQSVHPQ